MGREVIIVETVGVGQDEIDIAQLAHTTVVVLVPDGDDIQAIKVASSRWRTCSRSTRQTSTAQTGWCVSLPLMLELRRAVQGSPPPPGGEALRGAPASGGAGWEPPIVKVVAARDDGVDVLRAQLDRHFQHLTDSGELRSARLGRATTQFVALLRERLRPAPWTRASRARARAPRGHRRAHRRARGGPHALADGLVLQGVADERLIVGPEALRQALRPRASSRARGAAWTVADRPCPGGHRADAQELLQRAPRCSSATTNGSSSLATRWWTWSSASA